MSLAASRQAGAYKTTLEILPVLNEGQQICGKILGFLHYFARMILPRTSDVLLTFRQELPVGYASMVVGLFCLFHLIRLDELLFLAPTLIYSPQAPFGAAL